MIIGGRRNRVIYVTKITGQKTARKCHTLYIDLMLYKQNKTLLNIYKTLFISLYQKKNKVIMVKFLRVQFYKMP